MASSRNHATISTTTTLAAEDTTRGFSSVGSIAVRVAGLVPRRVDLRFVGTPQQQLGESLGTILIYMFTHLTASTIAEKWAAAAPLVRGLSHVLPVERRSSMAAGPWQLSAMVRFARTRSTTRTSSLGSSFPRAQFGARNELLRGCAPCCGSTSTPSRTMGL